MLSTFSFLSSRSDTTPRCFETLLATFLLVGDYLKLSWEFSFFLRHELQSYYVHIKRFSLLMLSLLHNIFTSILYYWRNEEKVVVLSFLIQSTFTSMLYYLYEVTNSCGFSLHFQNAFHISCSDHDLWARPIATKLPSLFSRFFSCYYTVGPCNLYRY